MHVLFLLKYMFLGLGPLVMAKDPLAEAGLHFDELNKLRVLEHDVSQKTTELKEECEEFVDSEFFILLWGLSLMQIEQYSLLHSQYRSILFCGFPPKKTEIGQFQKIVGGLIELVDELAKEAENEKMKVCSRILNE